MMIGNLRVQSFATRLTAPIPNVTLTLTRADAEVCSTGGTCSDIPGDVECTDVSTCGYEFFTDEEGNAPDVPLPAPDKDLSLDINNNQQPYSLWNLVARKPGYQIITMRGIQVFADEVALIQLEMIPLQRSDAPAPDPEIFDIPPHSLYQPEGPSSVAPITVGPQVLDRVVIPKTITVHLGKPAASAKNVTVTFRKYIANVASSEVYPTWPEQALRANIHAQISLALNRIYTEWYPSRGYKFNITNSTSYDQYYVNGRNIFEIMERITDDIFNTYVRRMGTVEPYYTEYCDGKTVSCKGMKQWGTVDRANAGLNALQILRYYYGNDIEIVRTNNIESIPQSYPGSPLRRGDSGPAVRTLQRWLTRIAKDYPFFGKPGVDGVFGAATESSVRAFQKQFKLTVDGVVGRNTWNKISYIYVSVKDLAELTSEGEKPTGDGGSNTGSSYPGTAIRRGDRGKNVEQIQFWLEQLAEFDSSLLSVSVDGIFGAGTENAVTRFQQQNGLLADGVVGRQTWDALWAQYQNLGNDVNENNNGYPGSPVRRGDRGDSVRTIQFWLTFISSNFSSIPDVSVDGIFGAGTEAGVRAFQREFGLIADGVVGAATWQKMYEVYQDVANNLLPPNQRPGTYPGTALRRGSSGTAVREAQYYLILLSAYFPAIPRINLDGEFGLSTENAVKAFQKIVGLTQDGVIGQNTWNALYAQASKLRSTAGPVRAFRTPTWGGLDLVLGSSGASVAEVQYRLQYIGYFYDFVLSPPITGTYDDDTAAAVASFQEGFNMPVTSVVDRATWDAINATVASIAAGAASFSTRDNTGEYPGYAMLLGSTGDGVVNLQRNLNAIAILHNSSNFVPEDGVFGPETEAAVLSFQEENGLLVTGTVDVDTWDAIYEASIEI